MMSQNNQETKTGFTGHYWLLLALVGGSMVLATGCCRRGKWHHMKYMKHRMMKMQGMHGGAMQKKKGPMARLLCPKKLLKMKKCLKLTDDQEKKLQDLIKQGKAIQREHRLGKRRIMARMMVEWLEDSPDATKLGTLTQTMAEHKMGLMKKKLALRLAVRAVLTLEQWRQLLSKKMGRGHKGRGGMGRGGMGRGGCKGMMRGGGMGCAGCKGGMRGGRGGFGRRGGMGVRGRGFGCPCPNCRGKRPCNALPKGHPKVL